MSGCVQSLANAEQITDDDPAMCFAREQLQTLRQPGPQTSLHAKAPPPILYSSGARRDFAMMHVTVVFWNFVQQFPHLDLERFVRCIRCGAKPHKDGISKPRRVRGLAGSKLVSAQKYRHPNCPEADGKTVTYSAMDPVIMNRLPWCIAALLRISLTHSGAMDEDMLLHLHHDVIKGLSFTAACDRILSFLRHNHNQEELAYITYWNYRQQPGTQTKLDCTATSGPPPQFGAFGSAAFSKQYLPTCQWCVQTLVG